MLGPSCPKCASAVALHEGRPQVTASGAVELWHPFCWAMRDVPLVKPSVVAPPLARAPRSRVSWPWLVGGSALVLIAWVAVRPTKAPAASLAAIDLDPAEQVLMQAQKTEREHAPPMLPPISDRERFAIPIVNGQPLDEMYPSLVDWTHPVTGTSELMPDQPSRHFGAERVGIQRSECGAGHCGVDLDGPRGRPVVAVADGVVVRVERHELGLDGRSGRYVRIEHDDGTLTAYMHLDDIADGLEVGDHVDGGQYIGTLGATAVYSSAPHLHFSLEVPNVPGKHGDNTNTHYVDPAPFLVRAAIAPTPDRRHAKKPEI
jgi:murein DD-endopeptidase MepM/ murein hydrolase activator NlpD